VARRIRELWIFCGLLAVALAASPAEAAGNRDPLPSWRNGPAKRAILRFVAAVTRPGGPDYVPPSERIAAFDNDGTLIAERPLYFQAYFVMQRIRDLAPSHPEWKELQPFRSVLEEGEAALAPMDVPEIMALVLAASAEITEREYVAAIDRFFATAEHPRFGVPFTRLVYQPMLELLALLRARGFEIFICSAGGPEFIRFFSEEVYRIPRQNVIGSDMQMSFEMRGGEPLLLRLPRFVQPTNERDGKPVNLDRTIGRSPILAFGNSDGDVEMLEFTAYSGHPHLELLLRHDDEEREYAYDQGAEKAFAMAAERGWTVVSMKESFRQIFPKAVRPPPPPRAAP
jgi:phosphoserine phosphatase